MIGGASLGCVVYGAAILVFVLCILALFILFNRAWHLAGQEAKELGIDIRNKSRRPALGKSKRLIPWFLVFWAMGISAYLTAGYVNTNGMENGLFAGQTTCPKFWPVPGALKDLR